MQNLHSALVSGLAFWLANSIGWVEITHTTIITSNKLADDLLISMLIGIFFTVIGRLYLDFADMWLYRKNFGNPSIHMSINTAILSYMLKFYLARLLVGPLGFLIFWVFMPNLISSTNILLVPIFGFIIAFFWGSSVVNFSRRVEG